MAKRGRKPKVKGIIEKQMDVDAGEVIAAHVREEEQKIDNPSPVIPKKEEKETKVDGVAMVLVKTYDKSVVVVANELKFEVVHMSGTGQPKNPKVFYLKVNIDKLFEKLTEDKSDAVVPAHESEIAELISGSKQRLEKELAEDRAARKKAGSEIIISQKFE